MKDDSIVHDARNFLELHNEEWSIYAKHALDSMKKDNIPEELPLPSDIEKLKDYLTAEIKDCLQNKSLDRKTWIHLNQVTLARIITFNARRGSEPSKLHITHWENADIWKRQEDIDNLTDPIEKILAKKMKVIYVAGKKKRRVPILLTPEVCQAISRMVEYRETVGVTVENQYLFPRYSRGSLAALRGWDVLHAVTKKASLQKPELITSTKMRKHMATVLQLMVLDKAELTWLTDHLGHSEEVHKQWYRQEPSTVELTKVARILIAKDKGESLKSKKVSELSGE